MKNFLPIFANLDVQKLLIACVTVGFLYYYFVFDSGASIENENTALQSQVNDQNNKKRETDGFLQEEQRMKEAVGILSGQYEVISKKLPTELSDIEINRAVESYARASRVRVTSTKPETPEALEIVEEVPWRVTIEGRYVDLLQFIYAVSSAERLTRVKNFTLDPLQGDRVGRGGSLIFDGVVVGYKLATEKPKSDGVAGEPPR